MKCPNCGNNITLIEFSCSRCGLTLPVRNQEERLRAEQLAAKLTQQILLEERMNLALAHRKDRVVLQEDIRMATRVVTPEEKSLIDDTASTAAANAMSGTIDHAALSSLREAVGESRLLRTARKGNTKAYANTAVKQGKPPRKSSLIKRTPENDPFAGIAIPEPLPVETFEGVTVSSNPFEGIDVRTGETITDAPPVFETFEGVTVSANPFEGIDVQTGEAIPETPLPDGVQGFADIDLTDDDFPDDLTDEVFTDAAALMAAEEDDEISAVPEGSALVQLQAMARVARQRVAAMNGEEYVEEEDLPEEAKTVTPVQDDAIPPEQWKGDPRKIIRSSRYIQPERPINPLYALPANLRKLPVKKENKEPVKIDVRRLLAFTAIGVLVAAIVAIIGVSIAGTGEAPAASAASETTVEAGITAAPDAPLETESVTAP